MNTVENTCEERLAAFRADLRARSVQELVQRHVTYGDCYALTEDEYFALKQDVGKQFSVHPNQIVVVGSAKLGFSIAPKKRYRPFGETSDIDVAFCSSELFDQIWRDLYDYWRQSGPWVQLDDFRKYLFLGWMRPDKLPPESSFPRTRDWWEFFRGLTSSGRYGRYSITGALHKDWHFLETYQSRCVDECQRQEGGPL